MEKELKVYEIKLGNRVRKEYLVGRARRTDGACTYSSASYALDIYNTYTKLNIAERGEQHRIALRSYNIFGGTASDVTIELALTKSMFESEHPN